MFAERQPKIETRIAAETSLAQLRRARLVAIVDLYRALGGGWQQADSQAIAPTANN